MTARSLWPAVLIGWALAAILLLVANAASIQLFKFPDPDDAMRLLEVRDLLSGQSWWDVGQHRLAAGGMHWSRLVDLPIAGTVWLARPILGPEMAERVALVAVPLATLFLVMLIAAFLTRRMLDDERARLAILIAPLSVPLLQQLRPMRIDHHGWQVVLGLLAVYSLVGRPTARNGVMAGVALATLVLISLEGLPVAVALVGLAALAWAFDPARRPALLGLVWSFFLGALALQTATRGLLYAAPMCDAVTPDWIAVLGTAALGVTAATFAGRSSRTIRFGALGLAGAPTVGVLLVRAPECIGGPFSQLDPLTRQLWYAHVSEGLPLWEQFPAWAAVTIGLPLVGLIGSFLAFRQAQGEARARWMLLIGAQSVATMLAVLVMRAGATANAFALPGAAWVLGTLLGRAREIQPVLKRTAATAAALLIASPGLVAAVVLGFPDPAAGRAAQQRYHDVGRAACTSGVDARAVAELPRGLVFAPLDIAPDILVGSSQRAIASGHHRNMAAMHDVMAAFTGDPVAARTIIRRYGASYVVVCPGLNEPELYREDAPNGFWARLERGERFDWLQPVPLSGSPVLVWRVIG